MVRSLVVLSFGILVLDSVASAGALSVVSVNPPFNGRNVPPGAAISVTFSQPLNPATVNSTSFWAFARWSGSAEGVIALSNDDQTITLTPDEQFSAGESVMVIVSDDILAADGSPIREAGYSWQFTVRAGLGDLGFTLIDTLSVRTTPSVAVRTYGGIASDLDNDGWLDLTMVNEVSHDIRVFMNPGNGAGTFGNFLTPPAPVGIRASPSEPSDFDRDGFTDICVANVDSNTVSILLGDGDGTYGPQQVVNVGGGPRGIAVLDVDGDGDIDIANTNPLSGNYCTLLNNGSGVFGAPTYSEGGGAGEWGMVAGDMDNDGILDLVIGAQNGQQILVERSNGNNSFTHIASQPSGGLVWTLASADIDGDGDLDITTVNGTSNTAAYLKGNGAGGLAAPVTMTTESWVIGNDLGDMDGDGDADWMVSAYNGDWRLYRNNGNGTFSFDQEFDAAQAGSCALMFDADNDRDLDLGLIDELADTVQIRRNGGFADQGDVNGNGVVNVDDLLGVISAWGPCPAGDTCHEDVNGDGVVNVDDLLLVIQNWG
jgi:hypothetical protein